MVRLQEGPGEGRAAAEGGQAGAALPPRQRPETKLLGRAGEGAEQQDLRHGREEVHQAVQDHVGV
jgi:hypothetical protein